LSYSCLVAGTVGMVDPTCFVQRLEGYREQPRVQDCPGPSVGVREFAAFLHRSYTCRRPQDAVVSLVLSEAVYKQLDAGGLEEGSRAVPLLLRDFPGRLSLPSLRTRWEGSRLGQRCARPTPGMHEASCVRCATAQSRLASWCQYIQAPSSPCVPAVP